MVKKKLRRSFKNVKTVSSIISALLPTKLIKNNFIEKDLTANVSFLSLITDITAPNNANLSDNYFIIIISLYHEKKEMYFYILNFASLKVEQHCISICKMGIFYKSVSVCTQPNSDFLGR